MPLLGGLPRLRRHCLKRSRNERGRLGLLGHKLGSSTEEPCSPTGGVVDSAEEYLCGSPDGGLAIGPLAVDGDQVMRPTLCFDELLRTDMEG